MNWYHRSIEQRLPEFADFDWVSFVSEASPVAFKPKHISMMNIVNEESDYDRKLRMLEYVSTSCTACSMCSLGRVPASRNNELRDPHVFSNLKPTRFMILGYSPSWDDVVSNSPLSSAKFDHELAKYDLSRDDFYISNRVRCFSKEEITKSQEDACEPFLRMELNLIDPILVIPTDFRSFRSLCPELDYINSLGKIIRSSIYSVSIYSVDLSDNYSDQMRIMCKLVKALISKYGG